MILAKNDDDLRKCSRHYVVEVGKQRYEEKKLFCFNQGMRSNIFNHFDLYIRKKKTPNYVENSAFGLLFCFFRWTDDFDPTPPPS